MVVLERVGRGGEEDGEVGGGGREEGGLGLEDQGAEIKRKGGERVSSRFFPSSLRTSRQ